MENDIFYSRESDKDVMGFNNVWSYVFYCAPNMRMMKKLWLLFRWIIPVVLISVLK